MNACDVAVRVRKDDIWYYPEYRVDNRGAWNPMIGRGAQPGTQVVVRYATLENAIEHAQKVRDAHAAREAQVVWSSDQPVLAPH